MSHWSQGWYHPKNPKKYVGKSPIRYLSSWELAFMRLCDTHPNILHWASETVSIPYENPLTKKQSMYIPDFLIVYIDKNNKKFAEMIEIKPSKEANIKEAKTTYDKATLAVNLCKWEAAKHWCKMHGVGFRVMTEKDLFR